MGGFLSLSKFPISKREKSNLSRLSPMSSGSSLLRQTLPSSQSGSLLLETEAFDNTGRFTVSSPKNDQ
jgi:hypothetical protein